MRSKLMYEDGLTLIEVLIVTLICGILAAIALPTFLNEQEKLKDPDPRTEIAAELDPQLKANKANGVEKVERDKMVFTLTLQEQATAEKRMTGPSAAYLNALCREDRSVYESSTAINQNGTTVQLIIRCAR